MTNQCYTKGDHSPVLCADEADEVQPAVGSDPVLDVRENEKLWFPVGLAIGSPLLLSGFKWKTKYYLFLNKNKNIYNQ